MPLRVGDKSIQFDGIYDESDGFDAPEGTFAGLNNYIPNRNKNSLVGRGAFVKYVDPPSSSNGGIVTNSNSNLNTMSIFKVLHVGQFYVTKPSNQLVTVMAAVCSFDTHSAGTTTNYMLRFFMNPSISGGVFGASTTWKDVTPYYIDLVYSATLLSGAGQDYTFPSGTALFPNGGIYAPDLYGGYIYVEDNTFATPNIHDAEGDKIVAHANTYYYSNGTPTIGIRTESSHPGSFSTWGGVTMNTIRVHKNLETGKIPYQDLVSTSSTFFDTYVFSDFVLNETFCLSVNTGNSDGTGRSNFTLSIGYINKTFFGSGDFWSRFDYLYDGVDRLYDKHLVYGFPNYDNVVRSGSASFDGITVSRWVPGNAVINAADGSAAVTAGTYKNICGSVDVGAGMTAANITNGYYKIPNINMSVVVNDFVCSLFSVNGEGTDQFIDRDFHSGSFAGRISIKSLGTDQRYNFNLTPSAVTDDGINKTSDEDYFTNGNFCAVIGGIYSGFRFGMHADVRLSITAAAQILGIVAQVPFTFSRFLTGIFITSTDGLSTSKNKITPIEIASGKTVFNESIISGISWDFHACLVQGSVANGLMQDGYFYKKVFRLDKNKFSNSSLGGNHLQVTGNPSYSRPFSSPANPDDYILTSLSQEGTFNGKVNKDYVFGSKFSVTIRDRLFAAVNCFNMPIQKSNSAYRAYTDVENVFFSPSAEFGGSYHLFDANTLKIPARDISPITGLGISNIPQGLDSATQPDKNNLLILGERGYKYVDLADNITANWSTVTYNGDACVAPKSVVSENGLVFCAGMNGVYMFQGAKKTDITKLGNSRYNKSWRTLSETMKRSAVGAYYRDRNIYALTVFGATGRQIICFDLDLRCIYVFTHGDGGTLDKTIGSGYAGGKWFNFYNDALITYYDESVYDDDITGGTRNVNGSFLLNNFSPKSDWSKLDYIGIKASKLGGGSCTFGIYCDGSSYNPGNVSSLISTPSYLRWKVKRDFASRGTRFAFGMSSHTYNVPEIHDIDVSFSDVPQKKMIKGAK